MKRFLSLALKAGVSIGLIWYATRNLDLASALDRLFSMPVWPLALAAAVWVCVLLNNTVRWRIVMKSLAAALPFGQTFQILYIGIFFNQVLPSSVGGDAVRMFLVYKTGVGVRPAVNSILLERAATLLGLILLVVATQPLLLSRIGGDPARFAFPVLAVAAVAGIAFVMLLDRFPPAMQTWRIIQGIATLAEDARRFFLKLKYSLPAIGLGFVGFSLISLLAFVLALGLDIDISLADCLVLVPPVMLVTTIPISVAGWGVRETAMVFALGFAGVGEQEAVLLSLLLGVLMVVVALPGALLWLKSGHRRSDVAAGMPRA